MMTRGPQGRGIARPFAASLPLVRMWDLRPAVVADALGRRVAAAIRREAEERRLFPWLAVAYGLGILAAFAADGPLSRWPPLVAGAMAATGAAAARGRPVLFCALVALTAVALGFACAVVRVEGVAAPILARMTIAKFEGVVENVEERASGGRIVLRVTALDKVEPASRPTRIRVGARSLDGIRPGDAVAGTARLLPPPEAARPGGYDFARDVYFRGIGAVGSVSGRLRRIDPGHLDLGLRATAAIDMARNVLTRRIADSIGGQAGAVAAALITGKRALIDEPTNDALRAAGIYHIVSISGLHMVLAAGAFFWITRALLALSPGLALSWPIKKIAALAGMAGAIAYNVFSGSDVATERSLFMILVMQGAILVDRPALSLRNLAISALLVLTREPETLLGPSLQMSYAAVAGLIAMAEWQRRRRRAGEPGDPIRRAAIWVGAALFGTVATTLVASIATGPFSTFHFQNLQPYGIIGNAATLPLVSFVVMPCAVAGVAAFPFGLDRPIWIVMGWGVAAVLRLAEWVAALDGSVMVVRAFGTGALALLAVAIVIATLPVSSLRLAALVPGVLGLWLAGTAPRPEVYVARDGSGAAIRGRDGRLVGVGRAAAFTLEQWLKADGDPRRATDPSLRAAARCDPIGCTVEMPDGRVASFLDDRRGFAEDCARAAIVISRFAAPPGCVAVVVDRPFLARHGATTLRAERSGTSSVYAIDTVRRPGDTRPWLAAPPDTAGRPPARAAGKREMAPPPTPSRQADQDAGQQDEHDVAPLPEEGEAQ